MLDTARSDPLVARHLGIVRLATRRPLAEIYDLLTDPADATDAALDAVEHGDLDLLLDLVLAAPDLLQIPFLAPYLAGAAALLDDDPDTAADLLTVAAEHAAQAQDTDNPTAATARLRRLARHRPDLATHIDRLTAILLGDSTAAGPGSM